MKPPSRAAAHARTHAQRYHDQYQCNAIEFICIKATLSLITRLTRLHRESESLSCKSNRRSRQVKVCIIPILAVMLPAILLYIRYVKATNSYKPTIRSCLVAAAVGDTLFLRLHLRDIGSCAIERKV